MKKTLITTFVGVFLFSLINIVCAQSTNLQSWEETATKKNGDYYKIVAPTDYSSKTIKINDNSVPLQPWEETATKKNGDYYKIIGQ